MRRGDPGDRRRGGRRAGPDAWSWTSATTACSSTASTRPRRSAAGGHRGGERRGRQHAGPRASCGPASGRGRTSDGGGVIEGRDIGTVVFPDAGSSCTSPRRPRPRRAPGRPRSAATSTTSRRRSPSATGATSTRADGPLRRRATRSSSTRPGSRSTRSSSTIVRTLLAGRRRVTEVDTFLAGQRRSPSRVAYSVGRERVVAAFTRLWTRMTIEGRENIPRDGRVRARPGPPLLRRHADHRRA